MLSSQRRRQHLRKLRKERKEREQEAIKQNGGEPLSFVKPFVPVQHGYIFKTTTDPWYTQYTNDNQTVQTNETSEFDSRKRKKSENESESKDTRPTAILDKFSRSIVRAAANKNIALLRELLEEQKERASHMTEASIKLFEDYPSIHEKYTNELNYALLIATSAGACEMTELLLDAGANIEHFSEWHPFLHQAVESGNIDMVRVLIKYKCNINTQTFAGSALHAIARHMTPNMEVARLLLDSKANVNSKNELTGSTPLHEAVKMKNHQMVELLLKYGAQCNITDAVSERTPLHWAAVEGNVEMSKLLADSGADLSIKDKELMTPWMLSVQSGYEATAKFLCQFHDVNDTDSAGITALHYACTSGSIPVVELLLSQGANFNAVANNGDTPLINAVRRGNDQIVCMLLEKPFINIHHRNEEDSAAIHVAVRLFASKITTCHNEIVYLQPKKSIKIMQELIKKGADINTASAGGIPILLEHLDNQTTCDWLIKNGANANVMSEGGMNILVKAVKEDARDDTNHRTTRVIKELNVDVMKLAVVPCSEYDNLSAVQIACKEENISLLKLLINSGADSSHLKVWLKNTEIGKEVYENLSNSMLKSYVDSLSCSTMSLLEIARCGVLRNMGHNKIDENIKKFFLPNLLKNFLSHECFLSWKEEF